MKKTFIFILVLASMYFYGGTAVSAPPEAGQLFNVRDYGLKGDNETNDLQALQKMLDTVPDGSVIYFPRGTYLIGGAGFFLENRKALRFEGEGALSIIRRINLPTQFSCFGTFTKCEDITITSLSFDNRATRGFGGLRFYSCKRIRIDKNHFFDSDKQPYSAKDRYATVFGVANPPSEDIWFTENLVEDLQVEIDQARRVHILNNRSLRPELATGIGWFSLGKNHLCEDYEIVGNVVIDPHIRGINVTLDNDKASGTVRRVLIARNIVICQTRIPWLGGIIVGGKESDKNAKSTWEAIQVIDNIVWFDPKLPGASNMPGIKIAVDTPIQKFGPIRVSGNQVIGNNKLGTWGIETNYLTDSIIADNMVQDAKSGILLSHGFSRNVIHNNMLTNITGEGFKLMDSNGQNRFYNNVALGFAKSPYVFLNLKDTDKIVKDLSTATTTSEPPKPAGPKPIPGAADQTFASPKAVRSYAANGPKDWSVVKAETPGPQGQPALDIKFTSPQENAGVVLTWPIPPQILDGRSFTLKIKPEGQPLGYLNISFMDANNQRISQHIYFATPAGDWREVSFTVGDKGTAGAFAPQNFVPGLTIRRITIGLGGNAGKSNSVSIADFKEITEKSN